MSALQWQIQPVHPLPDWFIQAVGQQISLIINPPNQATGQPIDRLIDQQTGQLPGQYIAQLLWQRGIREPAELGGFLHADRYQPTSPFEFGAEMHWAVERLQQAWQNAEKVAIWGDFDADGITATAVLWEGLGQFFAAPQHLTYYIPNRLTESHGLSIVGLNQLAAWGCSLIVTCDTGSTNLAEIEQAHRLGIDLIITDHHTLPAARPPVCAIINPRYLPEAHPLAHLSGVAVAYKLIEALYATDLDRPKRPLEELLDLVAIGLIADLVQLTGDCRYLAQRGIEQLQQNQNLSQSRRPGIAKLLEFCKRNGDRPTDISFGLGPRINAISRIHGNARFCVELLTSQEVDRCRILAEETELANTRRKSLQRDVVQQVRARLAQLDLSTCRIIVLADPQWSVGILGLVAGQIAQEYGRPTILLSLEEEKGEEGGSERGDLTTGSDVNSQSQILLARGSARSVNSIDLYQLVKQQAHLLHRFGGHPLAMGLSLPVENIPLFAEAINRQLREQQPDGEFSRATIQADLTVSVGELGKELFRELKLLEPCGIGNAAPKLLIQNCWFTNIWNRNIQDHRGHKVRYIKTEFEIWDNTTDTGFPGVWWDHYKDEIPIGRCDAIVELDFNAYKKRYEIRLIAVRPVGQKSQSAATAIDWILDWRAQGKAQGKAQQAEGESVCNLLQNSNLLSSSPPFFAPEIVQISQCPGSWDEIRAWLQQVQPGQKLVLSYPPPACTPPIEIWQQLVGIAKYLSRSGQFATCIQLQERLGIGDRSLQVGFQTLQILGFQIHFSASGAEAVNAEFSITWQSVTVSEIQLNRAIEQFLAVVQEEQFRRRYFYEVPLETIQMVVYQRYFYEDAITSI